MGKAEADALAAERKKMGRSTYNHRCMTCGFEHIAFAAIQRHVDAQHGSARIENNILDTKKPDSPPG